MKLYHESIGKGETVIFLHSGVTDSQMWDAQWQDLAKDYRLIRYDRAGFGKSAPNTAAGNSRDELLKLMDDLGIEKAHLVGSSAGGEIITNFALEHPEQVKSLVLVSSLVGGYELQGEPPAQLMALFGALQAGQIEEAAALTTQVFLLGEQRKEADLARDLRDSVSAMALQAIKNGAFMQADADTPQPAAMQRLGEISVPTLLIVGSYDNPAIAKAAGEISKALPNAQFVAIDKAAHLLNMEAPQAFNQTLRDFLAKAK
jgi:pimeloyl-ACP methyl ester carboxylesterase